MNPPHHNTEDGTETDDDAHSRAIVSHSLHIFNIPLIELREVTWSEAFLYGISKIQI